MIRQRFDQGTLFGRQHFSCEFADNLLCAMSRCISTAQAPTQSALRGCPVLGARPFSCKFSHKTCPVKCPCAFQLHAQSVPPHSGARHFSCQFSHRIALERWPSVHLSSPCTHVAWHPQDQDLVEVLVRRCCEDLADFFCCPF